MKGNLLSFIVSLACFLPVFEQQKQGKVAQRPITTAYNYAKWKEVKREYMLKLQKRINVNWYRAAGARRMDGTPTNVPDKPYSPLELE